MKNNIYILGIALGLSLGACQKKAFSPTNLGGSNLSQNDPTDPNCVSTDPVINTPDSVASGSVFTLSYNRDNVLWTLTTSDGTTVSLDGSPVSTSLTPIGPVAGTVLGTDNCGRRSYQEFTFEVTGEVFETTTTTSTLPVTTTVPAPTTTTLPPVTPTTLPPVVPPTTTQDFTVNSGGAADILFVVNDSSSMWYTLRYSIPIRFAHFVEKLNGNVDYKISVTSAQATGPKDYQSGRLTRILYQPVPFDGLTLVPYQYAVTPAMGHYSSRNFLATIMRPEAICIAGMMPCPNPANAYQEAIHSTIMALNNSDSVSKLVRPNAALNIVIISDDDEGAGNLTDSKGNLKSNAPSYNRPQTLIDLVQTKWPGKAFRAHAVIQRPEDPLCWNADIYNANRAHLYNDLVKKTGGTTAEICDVYDQRDIKKMANSIATASPTFQLKCQPTSIQATYAPQPAIPTRVVVSGTNVSFDPALPSGTKVHLQYQCQ